jgi:hypothetical protein
MIFPNCVDTSMETLRNVVAKPAGLCGSQVVSRES